MTPTRSEHGSSAASGPPGSTPPSTCVLQTSPCTSSLNMPSPPTHTTLRAETRALLRLVRRLKGVKKVSGAFILAVHPAVQLKLSPVNLLKLRLRPQVVPRMIGVLRHYGNKQRRRIKEGGTGTGSEGGGGVPMTCVETPARANSGATCCS